MGVGKILDVLGFFYTVLTIFSLNSSYIIC